MKVLVRSAKEFVRHVLMKLGAKRLLDALHANPVDSELLRAGSRRERFSAIYENGLWTRNLENVPGSGEGSSLAATGDLRAQLPSMLDQLGAGTVVDLGCGDFTWMRTLSLKQDYVGVDVVPSVVAENQKNFGGPNRQFFCLDLVEDEIPDGDTLFCREVLFHLSFADIKAVLRNCAKKPRRYLLATTEGSTLINADVPSGDYRRLNLRRPPFSFPAPIHVIDDGAVEKGRIIGVWDWQSLQAAISR